MFSELNGRLASKIVVFFDDSMRGILKIEWFCVALTIGQKYDIISSIKWKGIFRMICIEWKGILMIRK